MSASLPNANGVHGRIWTLSFSCVERGPEISGNSSTASEFSISPATLGSPARDWPLVRRWKAMSNWSAGRDRRRKCRWPEIDNPGPPPHGFTMKSDTEEPIRRKVGGSLTRLPPMQRLETLRRNADFLRGGKWTPPPNDGTHIRKAVGAAR